MIIACINCYNSMSSLPHTIQSIRGSVGRIIAVDGAYADYPHKKPYSTDGTVKYLKECKAQVIETKKPWKDQIIKRTQYFRGSAGDIYFIIDTDEILLTPFKENDLRISGRNAPVDVGWLMIMSKLYKDRPYSEPRFFRHKKGIHYAGRHHWIYDGQQRLMSSHQKQGQSYTWKDTGLVIRNMRNFPRRNAYTKKRNIEEGRFKDENAVYGRETRLIAHPGKAWGI